MKLQFVETNVDKLHEKSSPIDMNDSVLKDMVTKALLNTYEKLNGRLLGLAAIQCGYAYSAILIKNFKTPGPNILYNPTILLSIGSKLSNEGCISEGKSRYWVKRPKLVVVLYQDSVGKRYTKILTYKKARVFQHEVDHLYGILLADKGILVEE